MGYSFMWGRALLDLDVEKHVITVGVEAMAVDAEVHMDPWEVFTGDPTRSCPYSVWAAICRSIPALGEACEAGEAWCREAKDWCGSDDAHIPCHVFEPYLERIEMQAKVADSPAAARALWFTRWCRATKEKHGIWGVFRRPGEW